MIPGSLHAIDAATLPAGGFSVGGVAAWEWFLEKSTWGRLGNLTFCEIYICLFYICIYKN